MSSFRVVLVEHGYASSDCERRIVEAAGGEFIDADTLPLKEALALCETADGILVRRLQVTDDLIRRFKRCKILLRYGVGTDNVSTKAATEAGIVIGHVPTYCIDDVSTHAFALLLACIRAIPQIDQKMREGGWDVKRTIRILRTEGRTLGIVGLGQIGRSLAKKAAGWGWRLLGTDPYVDPERVAPLGVELVDLQQLCHESDYISLHLPLLPETHHLFGRETFSWMKEGSILVNTARGPIVENDALLHALDHNVRLAGLDVFEEEPLPADSPLRRHPRVVLTDHTAWYSEQSQVDLQTKAAQEIVKVCQGGLPYSLANPEVIERIGRQAEWTPPETIQWQLKRLRRLSEAGSL